MQKGVYTNKNSRDLLRSKTSEKIEPKKLIGDAVFHKIKRKSKTRHNKVDKRGDEIWDKQWVTQKRREKKKEKQKAQIWLRFLLIYISLRFNEKK